MPTVEIWDGPAVELGEVLKCVSSADGLSWSILEMWAVGRDGETDIGNLEEEARRSPTGLGMSAGDLSALSSRLRQFIDGIVVGYSGDAPRRDDPDLRTSCEVVIEAIDSTLWRVYARDQGVADALSTKYRDVRNVTPEVALPAAHDKS